MGLHEVKQWLSLKLKPTSQKLACPLRSWHVSISSCLGGGVVYSLSSCISPAALESQITITLICGWLIHRLPWEGMGKVVVKWWNTGRAQNNIKSTSCYTAACLEIPAVCSSLSISPDPFSSLHTHTHRIFMPSLSQYTQTHRLRGGGGSDSDRETSAHTHTHTLTLTQREPRRERERDQVEREERPRPEQYSLNF